MGGPYVATTGVTPLAVVYKEEGDWIVPRFDLKLNSFQPWKIKYKIFLQSAPLSYTDSTMKFGGMSTTLGSLGTCVIDYHWYYEEIAVFRATT